MISAKSVLSRHSTKLAKPVLTVSNVEKPPKPVNNKQRIIDALDHLSEKELS
jgi:hypothetical protein